MEHHGPILISVIMSKLSEDFRPNISRQMPPSKWILKSLLDVFKHELISKERFSGSCYSELPRCSPHNSSNQSPKTSSAVLTIREGRNGKLIITCKFCEMNHPSDSCHSVTEISARKELLKNKNRCFNYLAYGNINKNCTRNSKCFTCNQKHHVSIYEKKISKSKNKPNGPDVPTALDVPTMSNAPFTNSNWKY